MRDYRSGMTATPPWHVPIAVDDVPEQGAHFDLAADADVRGAIARLAGLRDLPRLQANFDVRRHGNGGLHVAGRISATVGQACVVTLEPLVNEVEEEVDLLFMPSPASDSGVAEPGEGDAVGDETEPLVDGRLDLGALATEFLVLGIDPYPRKPGAVFTAPQDTTVDEGPFAPLGALKKDSDDH